MDYKDTGALTTDDNLQATMIDDGSSPVRPQVGQPWTAPQLQCQPKQSVMQGHGSGSRLVHTPTKLQDRIIVWLLLCCLLQVMVSDEAPPKLMQMTNRFANVLLNASFVALVGDHGALTLS